VPVGLCEEMGFQPSSKLSTTNWWWAELWLEARSRRKLRRPRCVLVEETSIVVAFCRTKICPTRNVGDWDVDVVEVGRTVLTDTNTEIAILNCIRCGTGSQWSMSRRASVMCSYLPTSTTKRWSQPVKPFRWDGLTDAQTDGQNCYISITHHHCCADAR